MHSQYSYRDLSGLTLTLIIMLALSLLVNVGSLLSSFMQLQLLGREFTEAEGLANDAREGMLGIIGIVVYLVTMVIFCCWIVRANKNANAMGALAMRTTPGWAVGWFFIPIMSLFRPYMAMKDLWQASHNPPAWQTVPRGAVLPLWWTLWIISNILGQVSFRMMMAANDKADIEAATGRNDG